jgi:hypothetical protein
MKSSPNSNSPFEKHGASCSLASRFGMLVTLALTLPILLRGVPLPAKESNVSQPFHKRQSLDDRVERLARYLGLSHAQMSALKNILIERQQEVFRMRHASSAGEGLQMDQFRAIEDKTAERIRAILTAEQRKKYEPLSNGRSDSAAQNVSVEDWLKQTRP